MVRRNTDKRSAHQRIGAGGINLDLIPIGAFKAELQTATFPDPVGLHQLYLGGPVVEPVNRVEQFFGHAGDIEEPLCQFATFHIRARPPAFAVNYLLVGQHGHVDRVPVDHGVLAIDEVSVEHVEEQRLLLAVIFGVTSGKFARPVDGQAQWLHLVFHCSDVAVGPILWVSAAGHGRIFSGHAERVPAHRMQHIMPGR